MRTADILRSRGILVHGCGVQTQSNALGKGMCHVDCKDIDTNQIPPDIFRPQVIANWSNGMRQSLVVHKRQQGDALPSPLLAVEVRDKRRRIEVGHWRLGGRHERLPRRREVESGCGGEDAKELFEGGDRPRSRGKLDSIQVHMLEV